MKIQNFNSNNKKKLLQRHINFLNLITESEFYNDVENMIKKNNKFPKFVVSLPHDFKN